MSDTRTKFIETTSRLLEAQGYHATGLNQIIKESGAPRGSLYYHFPDGKEELAAEAVKRTGQNFARLIRENLREDIPLPEAVRELVQGIAQGVEKSGYSAGGPLTSIAMETATTNERLNLACQEAFLLIQTAFAEKLMAHGVDEKQAEGLTMFIMSAVEGAIMFSRTHHSGDPLRRVADDLFQFLNT